MDVCSAFKGIVFISIVEQQVKVGSCDSFLTAGCTAVRTEESEGKKESYGEREREREKREREKGTYTQGLNLDCTKKRLSTVNRGARRILRDLSLALTAHGRKKNLARLSGGETALSGKKKSGSGRCGAPKTTRCSRNKTLAGGPY
jgi:hypothetical protein